MPTYAGYDYTWCGGSDVALTPDRKLIQFDRMGLPDFTFSIAPETLDFESSLCTFQGKRKKFLRKKKKKEADVQFYDRRNASIWFPCCCLLVGHHRLQYVP